MNYTFLLTPLLLGGVGGGLTSCSNDDFDQANTPQQGQLRFEIFDAAEQTRAATDGSTMTTTFQQNDQAGVYAVKGGQVVLENLPVTYSVNGFWEAAESIDAASLSGATFYAYYPYSAEAQFNASATDPFLTMVAAAVPAAKQSTKAEYEAADIMTTASTTIGQYNTVQLALHHRKAMVCVELPNSSYIFNNNGMEPYVMAKAENAQFTMAGTPVQPYFDDASQSYRLIVEPGQAEALTVKFTNNGENKTYQASGLNALTAGQYAKYIVDGGASLVTMTLQVGDYYCADGRIVSKDATTLPSNIIGVIYKIGTTEAIRSKNSNWSHAVVISMGEVNAKWGNDKSTTSEQNNAGWRTWFANYNLAAQSSTNAASLNEANMAEEGYETTLAWRSIPEPLTIGAFTLDYTSLMNEAFNNWNASNAAPAGICTGWYLPSLKDWQNIEAQGELLIQQLEKAKGTTLLWNTSSSSNYWSCNVRAAGSNWCYVGGKTALADRYKGVALNSTRFYRFLLAF